MLASGLFNPEGLAYGKSDIFVGCFVGAIVIILWSLATSLLVFLPMRLLGILRVNRQIELTGLDEVYHGGIGYKINNPQFMSDQIRNQ